MSEQRQRPDFSAGLFQQVYGCGSDFFSNYLNPNCF